VALTTDEETRVRALLIAVRKLAGPPIQARSVQDKDLRQILDRLEQYLLQLTASLNV